MGKPNVFQMLGLINETVPQGEIFHSQTEIARQEATNKQVSHLSHMPDLVAPPLLLMLEVNS